MAEARPASRIPLHKFRDYVVVVLCASVFCLALADKLSLPSPIHRHEAATKATKKSDLKQKMELRDAKSLVVLLTANVAANAVPTPRENISRISLLTEPLATAQFGFVEFYRRPPPQA